MTGRLRIFVTTSHISCVYMTLHARRTGLPNDRDILLIDVGERTEEVISLIRKAATAHTWTVVRSFSQKVAQRTSALPPLRKRIMRRAKELPVLRSLYRRLLERVNKRTDEYLMGELRPMIEPLGPGRSIEVFGHTQTHLNRLVARMYPTSMLIMFEHGLGDYLYIGEHQKPTTTMLALFASRYREFLAKRELPFDHIAPLEVEQGFQEHAEQHLRDIHPSADRIHDVSGHRPLVFILLETVDMYEVGIRFWSAYIDHVLSAIPDHHRFHFILKPHPMASKVSLDETEAHCRRLGMSFTLLKEPWQHGISAEVLFSQWARRTEHVFCLFSSACFYLSRLYRAPHIRYHYSTAFMDQWTGNAPPMYKRHFEGLKPLIHEVFSERCEAY